MGSGPLDNMPYFQTPQVPNLRGQCALTICHIVKPTRGQICGVSAQALANEAFKFRGARPVLERISSEFWEEILFKVLTRQMTLEGSADCHIVNTTKGQISGVRVPLQYGIL